MSDSDRLDPVADNTDRTDQGSLAVLEELRSLQTANTQTAGGPTMAPPLRAVRSRKAKRTQYDLGQPVTVELRDGTRVEATMLDRSSVGLGVKVADATLFRRTQRIAVRQRGVRAMAEIRNVPGEADTYRLALRLLGV